MAVAATVMAISPAIGHGADDRSQHPSLLACNPPAAGMVAWWSLDEPNGSAVIRDRAGFDNQGTPRPNGTLSPVGGPEAITGHVRGAVLFSSSSSVGPHIEVPDHSELDFGSGDFSIECWVKGPSQGTTIFIFPIVDKLDASTGYDLTLINNVGGAAQMRFVIGDGVNSATLHSGGGTTIPLNDITWTHIAVTVDRTANTVKQYINGALVATHASPVTGSIDNNLSVLIGEARLPGLVQRPIAVDELAQYDRVLDGTEIQAIWAAGTDGKCRTFTITASAGPGGSIAPAGAVPVLEGDDPGFTITPDPDYAIRDVLVDGGSIGTPTGYTFNDVAADHTIEATFFTCAPAPSGMSAWWPLDEATGAYAAETIGGAHGQLRGGAAHQPGRVAGGVRLTGSGDYVDVPDRHNINFGAASFSMDAWVRTFDAATSVRTILDKRDGSTGYALFISFGRLGLQLADGSGFSNFSQAAAGNLTDGAWHHVAATVDRAGGVTGGKLYVDGVVVHQFNPGVRPGSTANVNALRIGQAYDNSSIAFNGEVDEVEMFGRAVSGAEWISIFDAGHLGKCKPDPTGCVQPPADMSAWWPFDEASGSSAFEVIARVDGAYGSSGHAAGMVGNAVQVTGSADFVTVRDDANVDFGTGDFSIDGWLRVLDTGTSVRTILDKRDGSTGYSVFISFGRLGLQMADGGGFTNFAQAASGNLTDGAWHHVAVSVDRDGGTAGGILYVDGNVVHTFNPGVRSGSLSNAAELRVGQAFNGGSIAFNGFIDEVELFKRALGPTEVQSLHQAGSTGKCKPVPLDVPPSADAVRPLLLNVSNNPLTRGAFVFGFALEREDEVALEVFDVSGRLLATIGPGSYSRGRSTIAWGAHGPDGSPLVTGVYLARLRTGLSGMSNTRRLVIVR